MAKAILILAIFDAIIKVAVAVINFRKR